MNQRRGFFKSALAGFDGIAILPFGDGKKADRPLSETGKDARGPGHQTR